MCSIINVYTLMKHNICYYTYESIWTVLLSGIREHHQLVLSLNHSLSQELRYIRDNKNLGLIYYAKIEYAPISYLLRQVRIKTENQLMVFSDSRWQDCPDTSRSTGAYIVFDKGGKIDHGTHVIGSVAQYSSDSE